MAAEHRPLLSTGASLHDLWICVEKQGPTKFEELAHARKSGRVTLMGLGFEQEARTKADAGKAEECVISLHPNRAWSVALATEGAWFSIDAGGIRALCVAEGHKKPHDFIDTNGADYGPRPNDQGSHRFDAASADATPHGRLHSTRSWWLQNALPLNCERPAPRRRVLAQGARAVRHDGYHNTRARQLQRLVLPRGMSRGGANYMS